MFIQIYTGKKKFASHQTTNVYSLNHFFVSIKKNNFFVQDNMNSFSLSNQKFIPPPC